MKTLEVNQFITEMTIAARIADKAFQWLDAPVKRVAAFDSPTPFAPTLEKAVLPNSDVLAYTIRRVCSF